MGEESAFQDVTLHGTGRQTGRGPHTLDVKDHSRYLSVISQADKFSHQRDARSGSGGHGARTGPPGAKDHTNGSQLIFSLDDSEGRLAIGADAVLLQIIDKLLYQGAGWSDRIPRNYSHAGEHAAQGGSSISIDDELAFVLIHRLYMEGVLFLEGGFDIISPGANGGGIQLSRFFLFGKVLHQRLFRFGQVNAQQRIHHAHVDHVLDQAAQLGLRTHWTDQ